MDLHGEPKRERAEGRLLALHLIELAVAAGWGARDCIEFAREAHRFVMSTLPEAANEDLIAGGPAAAKTAAENAANERSSDPPLPRHAPRSSPKWGPGIETKRKALQALADRNLMMREAAEILGVSQSVVASTAHKLKVRFHGRGNRKLPSATRDATAKLTNGAPAINGAAVGKLLSPAGNCVKRRCPSCNEIFEPADVSHYLCDNCENGS